MVAERLLGILGKMAKGDEVKADVIGTNRSRRNFAEVSIVEGGEWG